MRIHHLPKGIADRLGGNKPVYLKKVQALYCDRMTRHKICPTKCEKCYSRLEQMVDRMPPAVIGSDAPVGFWHTSVREVALDAVERYHEAKQKRPFREEFPEPGRVSGDDFLRALRSRE